MSNGISIRSLRQSELARRLAIAAVILALYELGRKIPLPFVDVDAYQDLAADSNFFLLSAAGGYSAQYSLFALGIMPYIWGSLSVRIFDALRDKKRKAKRSPKQLDRLALRIAFFIAIPLALGTSSNLVLATDDPAVRTWAVGINFVLLIVGGMLIVFLAKRNREYGLGGQSLLIVVNIAESLMIAIQGRSADVLTVPIATGLLFMVLGLVMENKEHRIPVLRVSVHSVHAEKSYLPIKWNPIGIMPLVFTSMLFVLPLAILDLLLYAFPQNTLLVTLVEGMSYSNVSGMALYVVAIFLLQYVFTYAFIRIDDQVESLLKTGDCLEGVRPGEETKRFLRKRLFVISTISAAIMSCCFLLPRILFPELGITDDAMVSLPVSMMILACICSNIVREFLSYWRTENYRAFL